MTNTEQKKLSFLPRMFLHGRHFSRNTIKKKKYRRIRMDEFNATATKI